MLYCLNIGIDIHCGFCRLPYLTLLVNNDEHMKEYNNSSNVILICETN